MKVLFFVLFFFGVVDSLVNEQCSGYLSVSQGLNSFSNVGASSSAFTSCVSGNSQVWFGFNLSNFLVSNPSYSQGNVTISVDSSFVVEIFGGRYCQRPTTPVCSSSPSSVAVRISAYSGGMIFIRVGSISAQGSGLLNIDLATGTVSSNSPNPTCGSAIFAYDGSNSFNTLGSPFSGSCGISSVAWFIYDVTFSGSLSFIVTSFSASDSSLSLYQGNCSGLVYVDCNDDYNGLLSGMAISVVPRRYYFAVGGYNGREGNGTFTISTVSSTSGVAVQPVTTGLVGTTGSATGPSNQVCASAYPVYLGNTTSSNIGATGAAPASGCSGSRPVWYYYDSSYTGSLIIKIESYSMDTVLFAWSTTTNSCSGLTFTTCNDDFNGRLSQVTVSVFINQRIYFAVGGYNGATGSGVFSLTAVSASSSSSSSTPSSASSSSSSSTPSSTSSPSSSSSSSTPTTGPTNQACSTAFVTGVGTNSASNVGATGGVPTGASSCTSGTRPVWYYYDSTFNGFLTIRTTSFAIDTVLFVWTSQSNTCYDLVLSGCNDDFAGISPLSQYTLPISAGQRIYYAVAGYGGATGSRLVVLTLSSSNPTGAVVGSTTRFYGITAASQSGNIGNSGVVDSGDSGYATVGEKSKISKTTLAVAIAVPIAAVLFVAIIAVIVFVVVKAGAFKSSQSLPSQF